MKTKPTDILLAEDQDFDAELIRDTIGNEGIEASFTRISNRNELLKALKNKEYDIILCDYTLPGLSDKEALHLVRDSATDTPFIYMSDRDPDKDDLDALKEGAADFIPKTQLHRLVPSIQRAVNESREKKSLKRIIKEKEKSTDPENAKEAEKRLDILFNKAPDAFYIRDLNGKILDINQAAENLTGYKKEEVIGKNFLELNLIPARLKDSFIQIMEKSNKGMSTEPEEFTIINKQGEEVVVEKTAYPMMFHGETSVLGIVRDITQRKTAEKKLRQSEEKFKALVKNTEDIIFLIDKDYVHRGMYGRGTKKLKLDPKDYIGKKISEVFDQETADAHIKALNNVFRGEFEVFTWRYTLSSGEFFLQTSLSPIYNENGEVDSVVGIARDLTETHELLKELEEAKEQAEESNRLKSAFLANISHEIRTPMNGIMGFTGLLKNTDLPQDKRNEFVEIIDSQSRHLMQIINDIIDISKMESDQFTLRKKETSVNDLLQSQYDIYSNLLQNKGKKEITLKLEKTDQEHTVYTDDTRLAQILSNLLDNAVKFTEEGSIHFGYKEHDHQFLLFYVKDTGIGIPEDKQDVIFESFRRVNESMTRTFEGAGLGLAITSKLVNKLGGEICLKSEEGKGTSFYFTLPYQKKKHDSPSIEKTAKNRPLDLYGKTIMVVEDDEPSRLYMEEMLKPTNAKVITAENGEVAWKRILKDHSISMILMDIKLPDYNGLELTGKIKKRYPHIPVIAQTAYAMNKDKQKALIKGCDDYISKPIEERRLFELINKYLKMSD